MNPRKATIGWVYFAHAPAFGLVKIGWSTSPVRRIHDLSRDHRCSIVLLGAEPGTQQDEADTQARYAHLCHGREWFAGEPALLAYAAALAPRLVLALAEYTGGKDPSPPLRREARSA